MARSDLNIRIGTDLSNLTSGLNGALKNLKRFGFKAESIGRDLTTRISLPLVALGVTAVKTFAQFDRLEKGLAALNGSAEGGAKSFNRLNKIVLDTRTTLDLKTAALGAQRLQGAGLSAAFAERTIKQLGIAATVSGSAIDDVGGVIRQFTQIVGKGKIEQEDLNTILDRMPALGAVIKKEFGTSTAEGIRATGISMELFVSRLVGAIETNESFQNVQGGLAKSFESFANAVQVGIRPLGEVIAKTLNLEKNLERLGDFVTNAAQAFSDLNPNLQKFIVYTALAAAAVGPLSFGLGAAAKSLPLLISGFKLLGGPIGGAIRLMKGFSGFVALLIPGGGIARVAKFSSALIRLGGIMAFITSPVTLIVAAIALVTIAFIKAYKNSEFFRKQIGRLGQAFSDIFSPIGDLITGLFPSLKGSFKSVGSVFNFVFSGLAAVISVIIEAFLVLADTVKAVVTVIKGVASRDLKQALSGATELFDLTLGGKAGKRMGNAFVTTFSETLKGGLKKVFASKEVRDFASLAGGFDIKSKYDNDLPETIIAPKVAPSDDGSNIKGGGDPVNKAPKAIQQLAFGVESIIELSKEGRKEIGTFFNEFAVGSSNIDFLQSKLSGLEIKPIKGLDRVTRMQEVFAELGREIQDGLGTAFDEVDRKAEFFGDSFDPLKEKIDLTNEALARAYDESLPATGEAVEALKSKLVGLTEQQAAQQAAQDAVNQKLGITKGFYESLGITFDGAFAKFEAGQKIMAAGITLAANVIGSAFDSMAGGVKGFGEALASATRSIVGDFIKQGVAAVVSGALTNSSFLGPLAIPIGAAAGAGANALFQGLLNSLKIPGLADGGLTTGPALALIGEGRHNEMVLPLPKIDELIKKSGMAGGGGGQVEFYISGENLRGVMDRSNSSYNRSY